MQPVAICLDRVQTEANAYLAILLPNLTLLHVSLERIRDTQGTRPSSTPNRWWMPSYDRRGTRGDSRTGSAICLRTRTC